MKLNTVNCPLRRGIPEGKNLGMVLPINDMDNMDRSLFFVHQAIKEKQGLCHGRCAMYTHVELIGKPFPGVGAVILDD